MNIKVKSDYIEIKSENKPKVVYVTGGFKEEMVTKFRADMADAQNTGQSIIPVVIDSYGGECYSLLGMVDIIRNCSVPVATIVNGKAMSAGAALFSCGKERWISANSKVMIHEVSSWSSGKISDIKADVKETASLNNRILSMMSTNIGQKPSFLKKLIHDKSHVNWFLSANEAKKIGLATHIGYPTLSVSIEAKYELR